MQFNEALTHILAAEGGYAHHPADPGGATRFGITQRTARAHGYRGDMRYFPLDQAAVIYKSAYWDACRCDELPDLIRLVVFDAAVNSGPGQSLLWLQRCLGMTANGHITPATLAAARQADALALAHCLLDKRLAFLKQLRTWRTFGRGWQRRLDALRQELPPPATPPPGARA